MTRIRHARATVTCLVCAAAMAACAKADAGSTAASTAAPFIDSISEAELRSDVIALAHDSTRGRLTGEPELEKASDWVRARFQSLGLEPGGDGGTFDDRFEMTWTSLGEGSRLAVSGVGGARRVGEGWYPLSFSKSGSAAGDVVFAGFGIDEPRLGYDDYRGADVTGKIVLVLEREPGVEDPASPFDGVVTAEASRDWRKALAAQKRGAIGILFVRDVQNRGDIEDWERAASFYWPKERRRIERFTLRDWAEQVTIPGAAISVELARALVAGSGATLEELAASAESASRGLGVRELPGAHVSLTAAVNRHVTPGHNVIAMVRGADPELRDEAVIIVGHHDMNGASGDSVWGGADDNASGAAGVLAVAKAYARAAEEGRRPARSVVFVISDAEERGPSLGAWHLTLHPPFPLDKTAAVFNLDMIGRNEEIPEDGGGRFNGLEPQTAESNSNAVNLIGSSWAPELAAAVEAANTETALTLRKRYDNSQSNMLRRSDQWPYLQNGVPAIWFHTGLHPDYHTIHDDPERLNYEKMTRIVRLVHQVSWNVANADDRPGINGMGSRPRQ